MKIQNIDSLDVEEEYRMLTLQNTLQNTVSLDVEEEYRMMTLQNTLSMNDDVQHRDTAFATRPEAQVKKNPVREDDQATQQCIKRHKKSQKNSTDMGDDAKLSPPNPHGTWNSCIPVTETAASDAKSECSDTGEWVFL